MKNQKAIDAYIEAQIKARDQLDTLAGFLQSHQDNLIPEEIRWGHVGDINRIAESLNELLEN